MSSPRLLPTPEPEPRPTAREAYDADDAARQAEAERLWLARMRARIENRPRVRAEQGIYTVTVEGVAQLEFDLTTDRRTGETHAELTVYATDAVNLGKLLHRGRLNLLSGDRRERLAKYLSSRTAEQGVDWSDVLEQVVAAVVALYREGEPAILLRDAPEPPSAGAPLMPPILAAEGSTILFGDGGSLKSYSALALAASLHTGRELIPGMTPTATRRVGFLDWEWSAHVHRRRLARLWPAVAGELPDLVYVACRLPMREERDRLRRTIREHRLEYLVIDSVGLAAGGEPESAEVAVQFFAALRELGLDALLVAHVTKQDAKGGADRPFGSAYWHNSARSTWYAKARHVGDHGVTLGLYHRKANDGPLARPFGLHVAFGPDRTTFEAGTLEDAPDLAAEIPLKVRMTDLLAAGALPLHEIAETLDAQLEAVKKAVQRDAGRRFVKLPGPDGIYRVGLLDRRAS